MMRLCVLVLSLFVSLNSNGQTLEIIRKNYLTSVDDKALCDSMIQQLQQKKEHPVYLAYLGAYQAIWANHTLNPIAKLSTFNKGKRNIESAVIRAKNNVEVRLIRWSVQKNAPSFLNYHKDINNDEVFIAENKSQITSEQLKILLKALEQKQR
ncbi:hypothetical protein [Pseudopedobacter sp.]|uniref:hypothetical protein n=1 Tax=Pseudopedobacter sp. TaxID=1936787 RepID=UPI00333E91EB